MSTSRCELKGDDAAALREVLAIPLETYGGNIDNLLDTLDAAAARKPTERRRNNTQARQHVSGDGAPKGDGHGDGRTPIELVLYVSSLSPHCSTAIRNVREALDCFHGSPVKLIVHDLSKDPKPADDDGIHFTPTMVTRGPGPRTCIVGNLANPRLLWDLLDAVTNGDR